jgi:hypothetical protein
VGCALLGRSYGDTCFTGFEFACWVFDEFRKYPRHVEKSPYESMTCKFMGTCWVFDGALWLKEKLVPAQNYLRLDLPIDWSTTNKNRTHEHA